MKRLLVFMAFLSMLIALLAVAVVPAAAQTNLLQNAGFESETYIRVSEDLGAGVSYNVPVFWGGGLNLQGSQPWQNVHPTGFPHTGGLKYEGGRSFHVARGGGTFTAWIYQTVPVQSGTNIEGGAWAYLEGSTGQARVGIDPTGGTNPFAASVIWSATATTGYSWSRMNVQTTASAGSVTLFLFATQDQPSDPNGVYWDAAFLNGIAGQPVPPPEQPQQPTQAPAAGPVVEANVRLNVRSGPSVAFSRIGQIAPGTLYRVLSEDSGWYQIDFNGQAAYVSGLFVTYFSSGTPSSPSQPVPNPTEAPTNPTGFTYQATTTINVRRGPGTNFERFTQIRQGQNVTILGRSNDARWVQIQVDGSVGWVAAWLGVINTNVNDLPVVG